MTSYLFEDKKPQQLIVVLSPELLDIIDSIEKHNKDNTEGLTQWFEYIDTIENYISNPVIAWDYKNKYKHNSKNITHLEDLEFDVYYTIKTDKNTGKNYVYIFKLNLKPDEFGLDIPSDLKESKQNITFNNLYSPIKTSYVLSYKEFCRVYI